MAVKEKLTKAEERFFETRGAEVPKEEEIGVGADLGSDGEPLAPNVGAQPTREVKTEGSEPSPEKGKSEAAKEPSELENLKKALRDAREAEKEARKRSQDEQVKFASLQSRLDTLSELAKQAQQPQQAAPDKLQDPVAYFDAQGNEVKTKITELERRLSEQQQLTNTQRIGQLAAMQEVEFRKTAPDYDEATQWLRANVDAEYQAFGHTDPGMRAQMMAQQIATLAANALAAGRNPAEMVYGIAKARGWAPKAAATPKAAEISDEKKVQMAANGQKQALSLDQLAGGATPQLTLDQLADMSEKDFDKLTKDPATWRKIMLTGRMP